MSTSLTLQTTGQDEVLKYLKHASQEESPERVQAWLNAAQTTMNIVVQARLNQN